MADHRFVIARRTARGSVRGAAAWGAVFGLIVYSSAQGFVSTYPSVASRRSLAVSLGTNQGVQALFGPTRAIATLAGFTAWRSLATLTLVGGVWGLLTATRLLRGEEEAGRWERLLVGATTRRRATTQGLAGLAIAWCALWALTAVGAVATGRVVDPGFPVTAGMFLAVALAANAAVFLAVGAVCSQLVATRRRAAAIAGGVFGVAYVLRLVAESGSNLRWLRWCTPFGWIDELRPLTGSRPLALLPIAALVLALAALTIFLSDRRDVGAGLLPEHDRAAPRTATLGSSFGLALRTTRGTAAGWVAALAGLGFVLGLVAKSAGQATAGSSEARKIFERLGAHGGGAAVYLGVSFLFVAVVLALAAAGQVGANRDEEADGRVDTLLARRVTRSRWFGERLALGAAVLVVGGATAGVAAWLGAAVTDAGVTLGDLLQAGIALAPIAFVVLGIGTLVAGVAPRAASAVAYAVVAWSFLLELLGSVLDIDHRLRDLSLFHHFSAAPAAAVDWTTELTLVVIAAATAAVGVAWFSRRDLAER